MTEQTLSLTFERTLWLMVALFKQEHPGVLEARTEERRKESWQDGKSTLSGAGRPGSCTTG